MSLNVFFLSCLVMAAAAFADSDIDLEKKLLKILQGSENLQRAARNNYDDEFDKTCPSQQVVNHIYAQHQNYYEDRTWSMSCRSIGMSGSCERTDFVNDWDDLFGFQCPNHGVISGMYSVHDNYREDRRFKFDCCTFSGYCTRNCIFSDFTDYDAIFDYTVPTGKVLRGLTSRHDNYREDRVFSFMSCDLVTNC